MEILLPVATVLGAFALVIVAAKFIGRRHSGAIQPPRREGEKQWVRELSTIKVCIRDRLS